MAHRRPIPSLRKIVGRHRLDSVFWGLLLFAVVVGGRDALTGLSAVVSHIAPAGVPEAEASPSATAYAVFGRPVGIVSKYGPHILQPVVAHAVPDWIAARRERAASPDDARPKIAIVIDDMGQDVEQGRRAISLPAAVSLSFLPYPGTAPTLAREARREGHEVLVHVPMEPIGTADPGPLALKTSLTERENLQRLEWNLSRISSYDGINNHEGSRFTADRSALAPVMSLLLERHMFFLDSRTSPDTQVVNVARESGVESAGRDVFLDDTDTADAIDAQLRLTEKIAREQGVAIAIGHPHQNTLDALWRWCGEIHSRGYLLIPVRNAIELKIARETRQASLDRH
jgi:polysaccharide deacetylase 2 family uncharacterized protein YibQ